MWTDEDHRFMGLALEEARLAEAVGEVPIGAVIVQGGEVIGRGRNTPISLHDATAHAEIAALRDAGRALGNYRLPGATLFVTLEPCLMCFGAMLHARIAKVVFAAPDPKVGVSKLLPALEGAHLNHRLDLVGGLREAEAREQLKAFFASRR
jgi:tRNA(adenine34) deaminase